MRISHSISKGAGEYINISISKSTIESKLGVCEDYANLLKDFLNSQGLEA